MSNDTGSPIPPLPERSAADAAAQPPQYAAEPQVQHTARMNAAPPAPGAPNPPAHDAEQPNYQWSTERPPKKEKSGTSAKIAGLVVVAALIGGGVGFGGAWLGMSMLDGPDSPAAVSATNGPQSVTINNPDEVNETAAIAAAALPSVVTIEAAASNGSRGNGSGVVLSEDGYVLTNTHVVTLGGSAGDAQLRVTGSDGTLYNATVVGTDPIYDLAVIKLEDATGLTPMEFADSADVNVGDRSVAIGAPMGLSNTVTTGVISNLNRSIEIASSAAPKDDSTETPDDESGSPWFFDLPGQQERPQSNESIKIAVIQTDAAINPGNSGGALVDDEGRLIGINVAIATANRSSEEGGSIGLGFAIPSNIAERVSSEIIENGEATHGLLGATVAPSSMIEGAATTGAYIDDVVEGAARDAGLQAGDIVTHFNGVRVNDAIDLTAQVRAAAAGSTATVSYVRDGEALEVEVTLGALE